VAGTEGLELLVSSAVRGYVADDDLERVAAIGAAGYECVACGKHGGPADGPASVVVLLDSAPGGTSKAVVRLGYARCCAPRVRAGGAHLAAPDAAGMVARAGVLPGGRPVLVTELTVPGVAVAGQGERVDMTAAVLLGMGLHLLASPWEPAPPAPGWNALLSPRKAVVTDPEAGEFYAGGVDYPPGWLDLAVRRGAVELLTGADGIGRAGDGAVLGALEAAASAGRLVGGLVQAGRAR
jgi:hypothetical protein